MLSGLIEAVYILLQHYGLFESKHLIFNATGSFFNPALAGSFIACSLCICIYFLTETLKKSNILLLSIAAILLLYALILTDSRSGWMAAIAGCFYVVLNSAYKPVIWMKYHFKRSIILKIGCIILAFSIIFLIYQYKKASADGRLFIWKCSIEMLKDKPLIGHGVGMFKEKYPYYQAAFFAKNQESQYADVAGSPSVPFNEYLSILTMQGLFGFILLIAILLSIFVYRPVSSSLQKQKGFLLTFCIFAFFSYPLSDLRLLLFLSFFIAISVDKSIVGVSNKKMQILAFPVLLFGLYYGIKTQSDYRELEDAFQSQTSIHKEQYEKIKYDIILLRKYHFFIGSKVGNLNRIDLIKDYIELYPSPNGLCELGKSYKELNNFNQAEQSFILASNMNPSLVIPNYELFLLYQEKGDIQNMKKIGEKVLSRKIKKESTASIKMKAYIKNTIYKLSE
nr:O-antigen ligase family protein [Bacteroides sp. 224]